MSIPKISVIIPIYGTEKYLDKCLYSVRNQTFKEIEIICVNDCSPDESEKIVKKHLKQDKRVRLINHESNLGLGGARNTAIRAAKADYLASVDSDDYMSPKMLETLWTATDNGWFDIVCCGYSRVDENGNILSLVPYTEDQVFNDDNSIDIFSIVNPAFWNKLWRKSLFVDNDIFFPEHDYYEDMSTMPRILAKSRYVKVIKDCLYRYLIRKQSIMTSMSDKHIIDYLKGFEIISRFLEENDLSDRYKKEFYRYIRGNILYYSKAILSSGLSLDKKTQYLRFLILFRITFIENFIKFQNSDVSHLLFTLGEEELHGTYYDEYQYTLNNIKKKESLIERHWSEIEVKAKKIKNLQDIIDDLKEVLNDTRNSLEESKKILANTTQIVEEKQQVVEDYSSIILQLKQEKTTVMSEAKKITTLLETRKEAMSVMQQRLILLEKEASEKISFAQMFAVFLFATLTYFVMNRKQIIKLINKPKLFFRDSKNSFAKRYASWFKII